MPIFADDSSYDSFWGGITIDDVGQYRIAENKKAPIYGASRTVWDDCGYMSGGYTGT